MARAAIRERSDKSSESENRDVGPPLLMVGLGFVSALVSFAFVTTDSMALRLFGYVIGSIIPILIIGIARRVDFDRRRSPYYQPKVAFRYGLVVLAVVAIVAAALHVWPIATELSS